MSRAGLGLIVVLVLGALTLAQNPQVFSIFQGVLIEQDAKTPNISTEEMLKIVSSKSALILDSRSYPEYAVGHIPGAIVLAPKPGQPASEYVSDITEVARLTGGDKNRPIVLYCNGLYCSKSKRLSEELLKEGYTNVRRYQLGAPMWRALGNPMVIEPEGVKYVLEGDKTAYFVDARSPSEFQAGSLPGARNVVAGEITKAKDERRLPMHDYNTRIVVFGKDGAQARALAEELTKGAFQNVAYFAGSFPEFLAATR